MDVERVLRQLDVRELVTLRGSDADIASRLVRNRYIDGQIESTVVETDGPVLIAIASDGLTEMGNALLRGFRSDDGA